MGPLLKLAQAHHEAYIKSTPQNGRLGRRGKIDSDTFVWPYTCGWHFGTRAILRQSVLRTHTHRRRDEEAAKQDSVDDGEVQKFRTQAHARQSLKLLNTTCVRESVCNGLVCIPMCVRVIYVHHFYAVRLALIVIKVHSVRVVHVCVAHTKHARSFPADAATTPNLIA